MTGMREPIPLNARIEGAIKHLPDIDFESPFTEAHESGFAEANHAHIQTAILAHHARLLDRISRTLFDKTHPVDEYQSSQGAFPATMELTANYRIPERIETYLVTLPAGTTNALMKLADRWITVYNGAALAASQTFNGIGLGIILNEDDDRLLTITPTPVNGPCHFELCGWADQLYG